jgi:hypothetical protein
MKTGMFAILIGIAMCASDAAQVSSSPAANASKHYLSSREANRLLSTATTPEEHLQLAEFFRRAAQWHRQKDQQYVDMEANYRVHPPRVDAYRNTRPRPITDTWHSKLGSSPLPTTSWRIIRPG